MLEVAGRLSAWTVRAEVGRRVAPKAAGRRAASRHSGRRHTSALDTPATSRPVRANVRARRARSPPDETAALACRLANAIDPLCGSYAVAQYERAPRGTRFYSRKCRVHRRAYGAAHQQRKPHRCGSPRERSQQRALPCGRGRAVHTDFGRSRAWLEVDSAQRVSFPMDAGLVKLP